ncbi:MAG TPA: PSPA7_2676 family Cys-rich small protein [Pseudomonas sp.]|nr:PSPA7_2676 family Cys-rich small protein [Pseudomonas sp.]
MKLACLINGCTWTAGTLMDMGKETLLCQCCSRCGSFRYLLGGDASS